MDDLKTQLTTTTDDTPRGLTHAQRFGRLVERVAAREYGRIADTEQGRTAAARVAMAFRQAALGAKDPTALYKCSDESIGACMALSARTELMPGGAYPAVYLVPKGGALQWWINHRGIIRLAQRSGLIVDCQAHFEQDDFLIVYGLSPRLEHTPKPGPRTWDSLVGVYVVVRNAVTNVLRGYLDVDRDTIESRRRRSQLANSGPWQTDPIEMAMKTAIKYAAARGVIAFDDTATRAMDSDGENLTENHATVEPTAPKQIATLDAAIGLDEPGGEG